MEGRNPRRTHHLRKISDNALLKGYELGVSDIINKPFNPNIVKRRVDNTIELYLHKRHLEALVRQQVETP